MEVERLSRQLRKGGYDPIIEEKSAEVLAMKIKSLGREFLILLILVLRTSDGYSGITLVVQYIF